MLSVDATNLHEVLGSDLLKLVLLGSKVWKLDVDRGSEGSAKVCGARSYVAKTLVVGKFGDLLDLACGGGKPSENGPNVCSLLHGDNPELILLVDPDKEGLVVIVEDASSFRPVSVAPTCFKESVAFFEQEVVLNELLLVLWGHCSKRIVFALELTSEFSTCLHNFLLDDVSLFFGNAWSKW